MVTQELKLKNPLFDPTDLKVFVQPPYLGDEQGLFSKSGFKITSSLPEADIVVFTGGGDIHPSLYGEKTMPRTHPNSDRDAKEIEIYRKSRVEKDKFKFGICRGGQLLNVLSGGRLWQDIDKHGQDHDIIDRFTGTIINSTSLHHQGFRPGKGAIAIATCNVSTQKIAEKESWYSDKGAVNEKGAINAASNHHYAKDYEVLFYPETRALCIQGHPEFFGAAKEFKEYVIGLVERFYYFPSPVYRKEA